MTRKSLITMLAVAGLIAAGSAMAKTAAPDRDAATKAPNKAVASADRKLEESAKDVDKTATSKGEEQVAERLAKMFKTTPDALIAEKKQLDVSWGALANANLLAARAGGSVTAAQLVQERKDGKGWGQIAAGLNLKLGTVESDARESQRVAEGKEKPETAVRDMERNREGAEKADHPESHGMEQKEPSSPPESHSGHGHGR